MRTAQSASNRNPHYIQASQPVATAAPATCTRGTPRVQLPCTPDVDCADAKFCADPDINVKHIATLLRGLCHCCILSELNVQGLEARHTLVGAVIHIGMGVELGWRDLAWNIDLFLERERPLLQRAFLVDLLQRIAQTLVPLDQRDVSGLDRQQNI